MDRKNITFLVNNKVLKIMGTYDQIKLLQTDDKHAIEYISELILKNELRDLELGPDDIQSLTIIRQEEEPVSNENSNKGDCSNINNIIWTKKGKHSQRDIDAIHFMLEQRGSEKYTKLFDDKRNVKIQLWAKLGQAMADKGFNVGPEKDMGLKLSQKFENLKKNYMAFNNYVKNTTGTSPKKPPEFFDEMDKILGDKHKTHPKYVINSMKESLENITENVNNDENLNDSTEESRELELDITEQPSKTKISKTETVLPNRFKNIPKSVTPKKESPIEEMKKMHKENLKEYTNHYTRMENIIAEQNNLLKEQNRQRDRFIECMEKMISIDEKTGGKRKRRARKTDSSESD